MEQYNIFYLIELIEEKKFQTAINIINAEWQNEEFNSWDYILEQACELQNYELIDVIVEKGTFTVSSHNVRAFDMYEPTFHRYIEILLQNGKLPPKKCLEVLDNLLHPARHKKFNGIKHRIVTYLYNNDDYKNDVFTNAHLGSVERRYNQYVELNMCGKKTIYRK